ncbi:hypothetical protein PCASD_04733 [Puccinia coronata f. sp. avenae]|uniref:Peptidase S8/S53 domain-containing protein n=1 Tax=Puccinia coronata f. sp. avenae TaxID=200324 RepID=A0A2N5UYY4_9BASI|nr:hypothetical protein PCASD_04733 [Puccinia coronata f. sp. avenae]
MTKLAPDVFYGFSLKLADEDDLKHLGNSVHVEKINQVQSILRASTFDARTIDAPINSTPSLYPPQVQTCINELHNIGVYGSTVVIRPWETVSAQDSRSGLVKNLVIDNSKDNEHGGHGNTKPYTLRPRGIRLITRKAKGNKKGKAKPKKTDESPCTQCPASYHRTHVAGIVAASDVGYGFMGVAPNVTLGMYLSGSAEDDGAPFDSMIMAMLHAHKDGADIILASVGGLGAEKKGTIIITAAGNDGAEGLFYSGRPASAMNAISVGSVEAQAVITGKFKASTGKELMIYRTSTFNLSGEYPIYITANSTNVTNDACDELPKHTPNLTNYIVLVRRGTCLIEDKANNLPAKGAKHNSTSITTLPNKLSNVSVAPISMEDGQYIFHQAKKDTAGFKVSFSPTKHFYRNSPDGGFPSNFSQYGPSFDLSSLQPTLAGVGSNVVSNFPMNDAGYGSLSGTSMAAPQVWYSDCRGGRPDNECKRQEFYWNHNALSIGDYYEASQPCRQS